jgi:hypothetical protein
MMHANMTGLLVDFRGALPGSIGIELIFGGYFVFVDFVNQDEVRHRASPIGRERRERFPIFVHTRKEREWFF